MESMALGAVPAALNFTFRSAQAGFELQQVPKETRELFRTISSTRSDIVLAKERRASLAKVCNAHDMAEWDRSIKELESALSSLEKLVESARVDMQHNKGKVKLTTKAMWVLRDSKSLSATHDRLSLAYARMGFCYQRLQFSAAQITPESPREQKSSYEHAAGLPPPSYQESTSKAIASRRREERERIERSQSVNTISEPAVSPDSSTPGTPGFTSPRSPVSDYGRDRHTPTFPARDGLRNVLPSAPANPRRLATTSAVHLPSNTAYQRDQELDRSPGSPSVQQPPLHSRSASMPYLHPNQTTRDRVASRSPPAKPDYSPTNLSPYMSQLDISSPRKKSLPDPETISTFSFEEKRHSREGSILSTPRFESSTTTLSGTPDTLIPPYAPPSRYYSAAQSTPQFKSNYAASQRPDMQPPASPSRGMPPYPVSRNVTVQSRYQTSRAIPEDDEHPPPPSPPQSARSFKYNDRDYDAVYNAPLSRPPVSAPSKYTGRDYDDMYHAPPSHLPSSAPLKQADRDYDDTYNALSSAPLKHGDHDYDDMYDAPPARLPASTPLQTSSPAPDSVAKTQRLFAGQRGAKEIRYKPYIDDERAVSSTSNALSPPPLRTGYQAYRPRFDSH